ncbi:type I secretion system permease/ATPase [Roseicyclus mahoneyensis]|uniref:PrtD family type I secretion system ABC transporter n=1 Tax=Roseicyclus mahoneyensis TaxID=164332 RepID=A0A316GGQ6_9RHOB|nr:type I secretion system permease/ATPase [Roseicyclus mahoneyensis]PWK59768.1 PrtD family type I secretion system ABC transporter [Roseicyclus mahoneyensis]
MTRKTTAPDDLTRFRRRNAWLLWSIAGFSMVVNLLMLTGPIYMLQVYDRVLGSGSEETLVALTVLIAFLFLMMGVIDFARARVAARYGARLQEGLDARVFRAALARAQHSGQQQGGLQDLAAVQRLTASPVFMAIFDVPWTPLFLGAIFLFHPWLGWLATAGAVVLILITMANRILSRAPIERTGAASQRADHMAGEMQSEAELIRALGMGDAAFARWRRQRAIALGEGMRASDLVGGFTTVTKTLRLFLQSAILGLGAYLVLQAQMTAGAMIAASILMGRALAPVELAIGQWSTIAEAGQAWTRLRMLLTEVPEAAPRMPLPRPRARLEVSQLAVAPPGARVPTLRGVSFRIEPGQAVGVIGPSGSGKSTLARAITSVWLPAAGQIRLDGATLDQYEPDALGRVIGYLPQSVTLFDGTIAENIARLDPAPNTDKVVAAARAAAAHDMILDLPDGYETRVSGLGARLSGGQIQRIGLARALYDDPVLLVLDEPNSALDNDGSIALNAAIKAIKADGRAVLIMAHRPAAIRECEQLLVLSGGLPSMFGPTAEVLAKTVTNYTDIKSAGVAQGGVA